MRLLLFVLLLQQISGLFIGAGTSAMQIEGSYKAKCAWDNFITERHLEPIGNATNHYLLYKEDVKLMADLNIKHYRFSISWCRIMPYKRGVVDPDGIKFYHNLLDELIKYNISRTVTLYHWEDPVWLKDAWIHPTTVDYFVEYAKILFKEYDSKVTRFITINEPLTTCDTGYERGTFSPGIKNKGIVAGHHQLLAHAYAADYYHKNYNGSIGMALNSNWIESTDPHNKTLSNIAVIKQLCWFSDVLYFGHYPVEMQNMPTFTAYESSILKGSVDFFGLNQYTTYNMDSQGHMSVSPYWTQGQSTWLFDYAPGLYEMLHFINDRYGPVPIYITESGFSMKRDRHFDIDRVHYLSGYIQMAMKCVKEGLNVQGFFVWSLLDNFEWASGYKETFGIVHVNRTTYSRTPKASALFLKTFTP
jgi:beta-glucosidase